MRANLREISRPPGGAVRLERLARRDAEIAAAHGHLVRPKAMDGMIVPLFRCGRPGSPGATASMLRSFEGGGRVEADHILGFLVEAARRAGLPDEVHEATHLHAQAYEAHRDAGKLPHA